MREFSIVSWVLISFFSGLPLLCFFGTAVNTLFNDLKSIDKNIMNKCDNEIVELILYGRNKVKLHQNCYLLKSSIIFILASESLEIQFYFVFSVSCIYSSASWHSKPMQLQPSAVYIWNWQILISFFLFIFFFLVVVFIIFIISFKW